MDSWNETVETRLNNMKKVYLRLDEMLDLLPEALPQQTRDLLRRQILGDTELKALMEGLEDYRPPRLMLIGRTGVGKSALINAICGACVANVGDTRSCTETALSYEISEGDRILMEILDTRGFAESSPIDEGVSAEKILMDQVADFAPDVCLFVLNATHRDDVNRDAAFLADLRKRYRVVNRTKLPVVAVVNKCDELTPARIKLPESYPQAKKDKIDDVVQYYREILENNRVTLSGMIGVSSLIDWQTPEGEELDGAAVAALSETQRQLLTPVFDGRYQIEELFELLTQVMQDSEAQMGMRLAFRMEEVVRRIAKQLTGIFSGISATVAITPVPISDIYILLTLQSVLVTLIAGLSGREISLESAKEFILSLGGIAGMGYSLRLVAQQGSKLIKLVWPAAGSAVSAAVAYAGTCAMGKAAIAYYIEGRSLDEAKKMFRKQDE